MQAHHRIVRREPELRSNACDGHTFDDHATKDHRVLGLESLGLHEHAPAIDVVLVEGRELELIDRTTGASASQFIVERVGTSGRPKPRPAPGRAPTARLAPAETPMRSTLRSTVPCTPADKRSNLARAAVGTALVAAGVDKAPALVHPE
jgi:hypothetical protein